MAKLQSLTIFAIATLVFAGIAQIQAADKEKAKGLLEAIGEVAKDFINQIVFMLNLESDPTYLPIYRIYKTWEGSCLKLVQAMIEENDECKLTKSEAQDKIQNILTSLDQAKAEADKVGAAEGLYVPDKLQQAIDRLVADTKTYINDIAKELNAELPDNDTGC